MSKVIVHVQKHDMLELCTKALANRDKRIEMEKQEFCLELASIPPNWWRKIRGKGPKWTQQSAREELDRTLPSLYRANWFEEFLMEQEFRYHHDLWRTAEKTKKVLELDITSEITEATSDVIDFLNKWATKSV